MKGKSGHTVCFDTAAEILNITIGRILATGTEEISERAGRNTAVATFVEQCTSFFVICSGGLAMG
jgi:hypothetical protein